jgi:hypothetical protein
LLGRQTYHLSHSISSILHFWKEKRKTLLFKISIQKVSLWHFHI